MGLQIGVSDADETREYVDWILKLGDRKIGEPNDGEVVIDILDDILIKDVEDPIASTVRSTYPNLIDVLSDSIIFHDRAILARKNDIVATVNDHVLPLIPSEEKVYLSSDSINKTNSFVNQHTDVFLV